eukprot:366569-Chlamydomonas_euryale.AAC.17
MMRSESPVLESLGTQGHALRRLSRASHLIHDPVQNLGGYFKCRLHVRRGKAWSKGPAQSIMTPE